MALDYRGDSMRDLQIDKTVVHHEGAGSHLAQARDPQHLAFLQDEDDLRDALAVCLCCCTSCVRTHKGEYSDQFSYELLSGRAFWSGKFVQDYGFHVANAHPLLSCLFAHPAHPYTKPQRIAILLIASAFTFAPTQFILMASGGLKEDTTQDAAAGTIGHFWEHLRQREQALSSLAAQLVILLFVTLPVMLLQFFLETLMVLDVHLAEGVGLARVRCCRPCCRRFADCLEPVKRCCLCGALAFAALTCWAVFAMTRAQHNFAGALAIFLLSRLQSWALWFPTDFLLPCCGFMHMWFMELRAQDEESEHEAEAENVTSPWKYEGYGEPGFPTNGGAREATEKCRDCRRECR